MREQNQHSENKVLNCLASGLWKKANIISMETGVSHREIRFAAARTGLLIAGDNGYRLISFASEDEISKNIASLRSRARKINERIALIEDNLGVSV